mmetsp:Transcript_77187/g.224082  ORF Transcript_77187/g.224082 Transcript_77187/m.224082 type:complete len:245 (-) Transcript_77187:80-814(-)
MLLPVLPRPGPSAAIRPNECPLAVLPTGDILTLVGLSVGPCHATMAVELILVPLPGVDPAIAPIITPLAMEHIVLELAAELRPARPVEDAEANLDALAIAASVPSAIAEGFCAFAVRCVVDPLPLVGAVIRAHDPAIPNSTATSPLARVHIAIAVPDGARGAAEVPNAQAAVLPGCHRVGLGAPWKHPRRGGELCTRRGVHIRGGVHNDMLCPRVVHATVRMACAHRHRRADTRGIAHSCGTRP